MPEILYYDKDKNAWFLASNTTPTSLDASVITSGTLNTSRLPTVPINKGGTGATDAANALSNLGAVSKAGDIMAGDLDMSDHKITNIAGANMTNTLDMNGNKIINAALGILYVKTLPASGWIGDTAPYTQILEVEGVAENNPPKITPNFIGDLEQDLRIKENSSLVSYARVNVDGQILFVCLEDKPVNDIPLQVEVPF